MNSSPVPHSGLPQGRYLPTEPLEFGGVVFAGLEILRQGFGRTALLAGASAFAGGLPGYLYGGVLTSPATVSGAHMLLLTGVSVAYLFFIAAVVDSLGAAAMGRDTRVSDHLRVAASRLLPLVAGMLLYGLCVLAGTFMLVLPGIWAAIALVLFIYPLVLEDETATASLSHSFTLTRGNWWRLLGFWLVSAMLTAGISLLVMLPVSRLAGLDAATASDGVLLLTQGQRAVVLTAQTVLGALTTPILYAILLAAWHDLRLRYAPAAP